MGPTRTPLAPPMTPPTPGIGQQEREKVSAPTHATGHSAVLVAAHMPMAARIARGFVGRGQELDDLTQVAMVELIKAAGRFDPARGVPFAQYAYPCIMGGLKKHFRDNGWSLHLTRRMQELHLQTRRAIPDLAQTLGRTPTTADLAVHLQLSEKDVSDGLSSRHAYVTRSLNTSPAHSEDVELGDLLGGLDARIESVADRHLVGQHLAMLPSREERVMRLRFGRGLCQREIAEELGVSQMHISRMITRSLALLRAHMLAKQ